MMVERFEEITDVINYLVKNNPYLFFERLVSDTEAAQSNFMCDPPETMPIQTDLQAALSNFNAELSEVIITDAEALASLD
jgi:hypothetical protein